MRAILLAVLSGLSGGLAASGLGGFPSEPCTQVSKAYADAEKVNGECEH